MGKIIFMLLVVVIIWSLWRLATNRRLPLDYFSQVEDDFKGKKEESKTTLLHDTKHEIEDEESTSKKD
ncbi:hypothetical protein [Paenisporosarcina sp. OV554]|uniref:hypothetical protein n=1 Tax=Paenisporosarcina sp. OV554 TaxID=2135694 RepID=UPI000D3B4FC8|nr:hypothetical protein [Paenisporosarcina sp. OV554]PUB11424.1 hypothetical protein C8K15_11352 [Paenisporosarcina sp. OV554]